MKNKKLKFYYFGDVGKFDDFNPAYVCNKNNAAEILYFIAGSEPYSLDNNYISDKLNINISEVENIVLNLRKINAIDEKNKKYKINFPVFLERDVEILDGFLKNVGKNIGNRVINLRDKIEDEVLKLNCINFNSVERILYHVICDKVFDGIAFDFFANKNIFSVSKIQPGERDYIIVAYEESEKIECHSNKLLCSSNNYSTKNILFNSFGDGDGFRKDMYRYFRLLYRSIDDGIGFHDLNIAYINILDDFNNMIVKACGDLINKLLNNNIKYNNLDEKNKKLVNFLVELNYLKINKNNGDVNIDVPVFLSSEKNIIDKIANIILLDILLDVENIFTKFEAVMSDLTSVKHKVSVKDVGNELWHQIFGYTNEYLIKCEFVATPKFKEGEGRYLQSIWL